MRRRVGAGSGVCSSGAGRRTWTRLAPIRIKTGKAVHLQAKLKPDATAIGGRATKINVPVTAVPITPAEIVERAPALVKTSEGLSKLERLLEKDFPQETLVGYIKDLCEAEDVRMTKLGGEYRTPNWDARKNGLDRVLDLLRYRRKDAPVSGEGMPVKLIFNVINPTVSVVKPPQ